jgi:hypothetical protein
MLFGSSEWEEHYIETLDGNTFRSQRAFFVMRYRLSQSKDLAIFSLFLLHQQCCTFDCSDLF